MPKKFEYLKDFQIALMDSPIRQKSYKFFQAKQNAIEILHFISHISKPKENSDSDSRLFSFHQDTKKMHFISSTVVVTLAFLQLVPEVITSPHISSEPAPAANDIPAPRDLPLIGRDDDKHDMHDIFLKDENLRRYNLYTIIQKNILFNIRSKEFFKINKKQNFC